MSVDGSEVQKDQTWPPRFLFIPERDLSKACPCGECGSKIAKLKAFEEETMAKRDLIRQHISQLENTVFLLLKLSSAAEWPKRMLDIFKKKLKAVSQKSRDQLTLTESTSADNLVLTIHQMLRNFGLPLKPVEKVPDDDDDDDGDDDDDDDDDGDDGDDDDGDDEYEYESDDVFVEIDRARFYYQHTKAQDTAYCLLQKIENIEKHHDKDKKTVEAWNKMLDHSISKIYIENQVEVVKKFPVEKLKLEAEELTDEVGSYKAHQKMYAEASDCISHICFAMITERDEFWKGSPKGNEHISNGVNQTLDTLLAKVTLFEDEWKKLYATFFTPHDRAGLKRQRT